MLCVFIFVSCHYKLKEHIFVLNILVVDALVGEIFSISIAFVAANVTLQFNGTEVDRTYYLLHRRDIIVVQRFTKESRVDSYKCLLHTSLSPHQHKCRKLKCPIRSRKMVITKHSRSRWCVELLVSQQYWVSRQYGTLGVTNIIIIMQGQVFRVLKCNRKFYRRRFIGTKYL